jgi:hypothetical protein
MQKKSHPKTVAGKQCCQIVLLPRYYAAISRILTELTEFWKNFNIRQAIENIYESWQEVMYNKMRAVWKYLLPYCANEVCGFENPVTLLLKKLASLETFLALKMLIRPMSENA